MYETTACGRAARTLGARTVLKRIRQILIGVALGIGYLALLFVSAHYIARVPFGLPVQYITGNIRFANITYLVTWHTLAIILAGLPIGFTISRIYRRPILMGIVVSALVIFELGLAVPDQFRVFTTATFFYLFDLIKAVVVLPVVAWLFARYLPPNKSLHRIPGVSVTRFAELANAGGARGRAGGAGEC